MTRKNSKTTLIKILLINLLMLVTAKLSLAKPASLFALQTNRPSRNCDTVKREVLRGRLGHAFNHHYMAIDIYDIKDKIAEQSEMEDLLEEFDPFSAIDTHDDVIDRDDHVSVSNGHVNRSIRARRSGGTVRIGDIQDPAPWTCKTKVQWRNLGPNYFPRYLRSVTCSHNSCWYGHFRCRPKHFKLKILKRKPRLCRQVTTGIGSQSKQVFEEFWEAKDVNVALCCECTH